ncbi:MAG: hypothetical protein E3J72_01930 [Planctomycetota bacterium]|nr:MAG: hypothetical protein E3J72_01930 [Planctomycetota bacterium]
MIEFVRRIGEGEAKSFYINLTDNITGPKKEKYGKHLNIEHGEKIVVIDGSGRKYEIVKHHGNQLWGPRLHNWFMQNGVSAGTVIQIGFNPMETIESCPVIHLQPMETIEDCPVVHSRPMEKAGLVLEKDESDSPTMSQVAQSSEQVTSKHRPSVDTKGEPEMNSLEKDDKRNKILHQHNGMCFVCEEEIMDGENWDIDHIKARHGPEMGSDDISNFAPAHSRCNKRKGIKPLLTIRNQFRVEKNFNEDFAKILPEYEKADVVIDKSNIQVLFNGVRIPLYHCRCSNVYFFYHTIPTKHIKKDAVIQPRPLYKDKLTRLGEHLQNNFQLSPSVGRLEDNEVLIFDGQHKIAAQILWNGLEEVECKVLVGTDRRMIDNVIEQGHGPLRQMSFKSSELGRKLKAQFGEHIEMWKKNNPGKDPSEKDIFFEQLRYSKSQRRKAIIRLRAESVKDISTIKDYISKRKDKRFPLTDLMFEKIIKAFANIEPLEVPMESENDLRSEEERNLAFLLDRIFDFSLKDNWPHDGRFITEQHKVVRNQYREQPFEVWIYLLNEALHYLCGKASDESVCYSKEWDDVLKSKISRAVKFLFEHSAWLAPEIEPLFYSKKKEDILNKLSSYDLTHNSIHNAAVKV